MGPILDYQRHVNRNYDPPWKIHKPIEEKSIYKLSKCTTDEEREDLHKKERRRLQKELWLTYQTQRANVQGTLRREMVHWVIYKYSQDRRRQGDKAPLVAVDHKTVGAAFRVVDTEPDKVAVAKYFRRAGFCCKGEELSKVAEMMEQENGQEAIRVILNCAKAPPLPPESPYYRPPLKDMEDFRVTRDKIILHDPNHKEAETSTWPGYFEK